MSEALADRVRLRIKVEMVKKGIDARQLARLMHVGEMWLSRRLRGLTEFDLAELERVATALDLQPDMLLEPVA